MRAVEMPFNTTLADITTRLRHDEFQNKQAISQGVVLRVLRELGWEPDDTNVVSPEHPTAGGGRADFALCHPPSEPKVFIEVKYLGKAEGAVEPALLLKSGVPFVVLTDGRTWSFYLPAEPGDYDERRICKLDLYERSPDEAAEKLCQYLANENVVSGESFRAARTEYHNRRSQAKAAIREAWRELVQKRDSSLVKILADAVESKVGFAPDAGDVLEVLGGAAAPDLAPESVTVPPRPSPKLRPAQGRDAELTPEELADRLSIAGTNRAASRRATKSQQLVIRGREYPRGLDAKDAYVEVLRTLADSDPSLLEGLAQRPAATRRTGRYIGRTRDELHPIDPGARRQAKELPGGWWVATKLTNRQKRRFLDLAVELAVGWSRKDIVLPF